MSIGTGNPSQFLVNEHQRLVDDGGGHGFDLFNLGGRMPVWLDYDNDHRLDMVMTQYGGVAKLFHQNSDRHLHGDQRQRQAAVHAFPLRAVDRRERRRAPRCPVPGRAITSRRRSTTPPSTRGRRSTTAPLPAPFFPLVNNVADSAIADFNNDGRMDIFVLGGVQLRPSSVVQEGNDKIEALLAGGSKGFKFVSTGTVTFTIDWNKADEGVAPTSPRSRSALERHPSRRRPRSRSTRPIRPLGHASCPDRRRRSAAHADLVRQPTAPLDAGDRDQADLDRPEASSARATSR